MFKFDETDKIFTPRISVTGKAGETLVAQDLHNRRFHVYVPLAYNLGPDLVIRGRRRYLSVEVKTGRTNMPPSCHVRQFERGIDIVAYVNLSSREIRYATKIKYLEADLRNGWEA